MERLIRLDNIDDRTRCDCLLVALSSNAESGTRLVQAQVLKTK
jgi:hypothetical protein